MRARMSDRNILDIEADKLRRALKLVVNHDRAADHEDVTPQDCGIDPDYEWKSTLIQRVDKRTGTVEYLPRVANLIKILEQDPVWRGRLRLDEFRQGVTDRETEWADHHAIELKAWLEERWIAAEVKTNLVREAVEAVANRHSFHPVREWLDGLRWDGEARIGAFFSEYCGTPFSPYACAVARSMFISAVARIYRPGCKVDTMVVLEGNQGIGKSKLVQALFGARWHCDITQEPGSLDFYQNLRGKWVGEFSELSAMGKADQNKVKQALTQTQDTYRASYGHYSRTYPRQFVFIGNTNKAEYLADETGARRYLPIECTEIASESVEANRELLWAEAVARYQAGEIWWDIPDSEREQERRYQDDAWADYIAPWLEGKTRVLMSEILSDALMIKIERQDRASQTRVGAILRKLGWRVRQETAGARRRFYVKSTT